MRRFRVCLLSLFICIPVFATTDTTAVDRLFRFVKNIKEFNYHYPQEKVYLHFDNTGYYLGERIWFQSYVVTADAHNLTDLSRILYVELLNAKGKILETKKMKVENGRCPGDFILKSEYGSGFYEIRAYTRSMLNFGNSFLFSRVFPVFKSPEEEGDYSEREIDDRYDKKNGLRESPQNKKDIQLAFYPEGGALIAGLPSRVAFKATNKAGENIYISGEIYNSKDEFITRFTTEHQGMGAFALTAEAEVCKAKVIYNNQTYIVPLPVPQESGCVLSAQQQSSTLSVQILSAGSFVSDTLGLTIACRGEVYFFDIFIPSHSKTFFIDTKDFPAGVHNLTIFDKKGEVFAERLFFVNQPSESYLSAHTAKEIYEPFEKIELELMAKRKDGTQIPAYLSVSVRDASSSFEEYYGESIASNLLLSSELQGYIPSPGYYFQGKTEQEDSLRLHHLDLLMLVHGWRRYEWRRMSGQETFEVHHPIEDGLLINGRILTSNSKKPMKDVGVRIWINANESSLSGNTRTNPDGSFAFLLDSLDLYDEFFLGIQSYNKGKTIASHIMLDRLFVPKGKSYSPDETNIDNRYYHLPRPVVLPISQRSLSEEQFLQQVVIKRKISHSNYEPDIVYDVEKDVDNWLDQGKDYPMRVWDYLLEKKCLYDKANNTYGGRAVQISCSHRGSKQTKRRLELNGPLIELDLKEVSRIEIYHRAFGSSEPVVLIVIHLFDNGVREFLPSGVRHTNFLGYSRVKEFYMPDYDKNPPLPGDIDFRRTLYWNPDIQLDATGKTKVHFFNNSSRTQVKVSCEGITVDGGLPYK